MTLRPLVFNVLLFLLSITSCSVIKDDVDDLPFGPNPQSAPAYRLSPFLRPLHYEVTLNVTVKGRNGAEQSTVAGIASIHFRIDGNASNMVEIHAERIEALNFISLSSTKGETFNPKSNHYDDYKRTNVWEMGKPLKNEEEYVLRVNWATPASSKGFYGVYETWETSSTTGQRFYQLATQGEVMGTRKWMPAFDEPALKATFSFTLIHPSDLNARSNAPVKSIEKSVGNITTTVFSKTARISPYLFAWSLTDYPEASAKVNGVTVSVIAKQSEQGLNASLDNALFAAKSYFDALSINTSHTFEKMDFVFVPDHGSAMENVGHITSDILTISDRRVYVHEFMHQYFGNLVTLSWWDEVWINEGITTMYEIDEHYGIETKEANSDLRMRRGLHIRHDSLRNTIALKNDVNAELESWANFDKSYSKGSVVLFMIRNLVGEIAWKKGMEIFLNKFAYKTAKGADFFATMREVCKSLHVNNTDFAIDMAKDFLELKGFPILKIKREGRKIQLSQVRFVRGFFEGSDKWNTSLTTLWRIPVHLVKIDGTPYKTILMSSRAMTVEVDTDDCLIIDPKKIVYYRAIYDANVYQQIYNAKLGEEETDLILFDLLFASFTGYAEPSFALDIIYGDLKMHEDISMRNKIYAVLKPMLSLDLKWHLTIFGLLTNGRFGYPSTGLPDYPNFHPRPESCKDILSVEDAYKQYSENRTKIELFFCASIKKSMGEGYYKDILNSFFFGAEQKFHPRDVKLFVPLLWIHYPNATADWMVNLTWKISSSFTEQDYASILFRVKDGFDIGHTKQLRQIYNNAPRAARDNREFISRIFNEHYAAVTEAKELGDKIEASLEKHLKKPKLGRSRVLSTGWEPDMSAFRVEDSMQNI